jgi:hypothetical protein
VIALQREILGGKRDGRQRPAFRLLIEGVGKVGWNAEGAHSDISRRIAIRFANEIMRKPDPIRTSSS